jgi:hypothetical protein
MSENRSDEENLRQEFEALGKNLVEALRSAWEAPESRRLREEMTSSLAELGVTLKREAEFLANSPAAQQARQGVEQVGEKLRAPEVHQKVRTELVSALQNLNQELQKVIERWQASPGDAAPSGTQTDEPHNDNPEGIG